MLDYLAHQAKLEQKRKAPKSGDSQGAGSFPEPVVVEEEAISEKEHKRNLLKDSIQRELKDFFDRRHQDLARSVIDELRQATFYLRGLFTALP